MSKSASVAPEDNIENTLINSAPKSRSGSKASIMEMIPNFVTNLFSSPKSSAKVGITSQSSDETIATIETPIPTMKLELVSRETLDSWNFNVLEYSNEQLCEIMVQPFNIWNVLTEFKVPQHVFQNFLREVSGIYLKDNFYHNFKHGCDVMHTVYRLIAIPRLDEVFPKLDLFCILVAAISHDVGHLGVNNAFLINSKHELAIQYPTSPLENMHCAKLLELIGKDDTNIFVNLTGEQMVGARAVILTSIMGTDMINHGRQLQQTQAFLTSNGEEVRAYCDGSKSQLDCLSSDENRLFMLELVLHAADISNPYKPFELCEKWAVLVVEEFCAQGDRERREGLSVSPLCDRETMILCNSQMGFIEFVMAPLVIAYVSIFPPLHEIVTNINNNYKQWAQRRQAELRLENKAGTNVEEECGKLDEKIEKFAVRMSFVEAFKANKEIGN